MAHSIKRLRPALAVLAVAALLASCADTSSDTKNDSGAESTYETGLVNIADAGDPVKGGSITFGAFSEPAVLDPAQTIVAGSTGGLEMAAVYDVLMRWDSAENKVVPQLAESLEPNEDFTEWTLKLRPDVKFSDGSVLDSAAVKYSIERYVEAGADEAKLWTGNLKKMETPDPTTVVFELSKTWPSFDYLLTTGSGMIVSKSSDKGGKFTPVGAGAFTLGQVRPQEKMTLEANPGYWDGAPNLEKVEIVYLNAPATTRDSFEAGDIDLGFLRDPDLVDKQLDAKTAGYLNMVSLGNVVVINASEGRPGEDPRVRQAMHMAIDPKLINNRTYDGAGVSSNEIFPDYSVWHTETDALPYDPEAAKKLVEEAKADGFDGKVSYLDSSDPASRESGLAIKASLDAVGFDVTLNLVRSIQDQIVAVAVEGNYDIAGWGISWREAGPFGRMYATLHSDGNLSVGMPTSPELDALIEEFQGAATIEDQKAVVSKIQEQWNEQVPALVFGPTPEFLMFGDDVHGVVDTTNSMVLLDEAWVG